MHLWFSCSCAYTCTALWKFVQPSYGGKEVHLVGDAQPDQEPVIHRSRGFGSKCLVYQYHWIAMTAASMATCFFSIMATALCQGESSWGSSSPFGSGQFFSSLVSLSPPAASLAFLFEVSEVGQDVRWCAARRLKALGLLISTKGSIVVISIFLILPMNSVLDSYWIFLILPMSSVLDSIFLILPESSVVISIFVILLLSSFLDSFFWILPKSSVVILILLVLPESFVVISILLTLPMSSVLDSIFLILPESSVVVILMLLIFWSWRRASALLWRSSCTQFQGWCTEESVLVPALVPVFLYALERSRSSQRPPRRLHPWPSRKK